MLATQQSLNSMNKHDIRLKHQIYLMFALIMLYIALHYYNADTQLDKT